MSADPTSVAKELRPTVRAIDLTTVRTIHVLGIGGAGMRAIARILLAMGHRLSGSDRSPSIHLDELSKLGATVHVGHDGTQVAAADFVTRSTAVPDDNCEVVAAIERGIPVYSRAEILAAITSVRPAILIAGTHGKTTTSSMLAVVLDHAGLAPSFIVGADIGYFRSGARWGTSGHFVVEADESDGTFLTLPGVHAVVTSLDPDHLEFYGTPERLTAAFEAFVDGIDGLTAVCIDDPDTHSLIGRDNVVTYGMHRNADLRLGDIKVDRDTTTFTVSWRGEAVGRTSVGLPGHHNALNAAAALSIALNLGVSFDTASGGLSQFNGVARRFENRGEHLGVRFVDDYAHLPAEVEAAIATAKQGSWNRVVAAYQPHRYSRTAELGASFASSFRGVDHLVLTDIYSAGETPRPGVSGRLVHDAVTAACPDLSVSWQASIHDVATHLGEILGPGDLCLTLGAGDLTAVPDLVLDQMRTESAVSVDWLVELAPQLQATSVRFDAPIGPLTTYRVGGAALALAEVGSLVDLESIVRSAQRHGTPILSLGKGSNLLVADRGYRGLVISLVGEFDKIAVDGTTVTLGSAVALPTAARMLAAQSLRDFEWAVGVPGSIGGAVAMNAGGHGSDMAATITGATVLDLTTGEVSVRTLEELEFGYRRSSVGPADLVLEATMELRVGDKSDAEALITEIVRWRRDNQPGGQNAGSVFTNPEDDSAGRLLDTAGAKGVRIGTAQVSEKHANFIQADPRGSADDVLELMHHLIDRVRANSGVELNPETRLVGFEPDSATTQP